MKRLIIPLIFILASCSGNNCTYSKVKITMQVNQDTPTERTVEGCFKVTKDQIGLISIEDQAKRITTSYYLEGNNQVDMLNIKMMDNTSEWRRKKGHDIFYVEKPDTLGIIFGDRNSSLGSVKGSVMYIK